MAEIIRDNLDIPITVGISVGLLWGFGLIRQSQILPVAGVMVGEEVARKFVLPMLFDRAPIGDVLVQDTSVKRASPNRQRSNIRRFGALGPVGFGF